MAMGKKRPFKLLVFMWGNEIRHTKYVFIYSILCQLLVSHPFRHLTPTKSLCRSGCGRVFLGFVRVQLGTAPVARWPGRGLSGTVSPPGLFPESALEIVGKGFRQVAERRAFAGLDKDLDRHAGKQGLVPETGDFFAAYTNFGGVILYPAAFIG